MNVSIVGLDSIYWPTAFVDVLTRCGENARLSAVCDLGCDDAAVESQIGLTARDLAGKAGVPVVHSAEEAAARSQACFVCTRHTRMPGLIMRLLDLGMPVFAAKPVALTGELARTIAVRRQRSGLACAAGLTARSSPVIRTACRLVAEGALGEVLSVRVAHQHGRFADWPAGWWYTEPAEGGPIRWLGWYAADGVLALTGGRIVSVAGAGQAHAARWGMPDLIRGMMKLSDGRIATAEIHFTFADWGIAPFEIEVVCSRGVIRGGGAAALTVLADGGPRDVPLDDAADPLAFEVAAWLRAIEGRGVPVLSLDDAAELVAVAEAWNDAARDGRWVDVHRPA